MPVMKFDASHGGAFICRGPILADDNFLVTVTQHDQITTAGTVTRNTRKDAVWDDTAGAVTNRTAILSGATSYQSLDPAIATMTGNVVTYVSDGTARINCYGPINVKQVLVPCTRITGASFSTWVSWVSGSLAAHMYSTGLAFATAHNPGTDLSPYSFIDHTAGVYTRNPNLWINGVDLTGISPWNSVGIYKRAGTLITKKHFLHNVHFPIDVGATMRFVGPDNSVTTRTVTNLTKVPDTWFDSGLNPGLSYGTDILVGTLNADVSTNITPFKFAPDNLEHYLPSIYQPTLSDLTIGTGSPYTIVLPVYSKTQDNVYQEADFNVFGSSLFGVPPYHFYPLTSATSLKSINTTLATYCPNGWRSGDSGNPVWMVVNNLPILLTTAGMAGPTGVSGTLFKTWRTAIETIISPYTLSIADFTGFPTY